MWISGGREGWAFVMKYTPCSVGVWSSTSFHSIAWRDYSGQSEFLAKCHPINSTISALTRMDSWHSVVERSNNNILEAASWKRVLNRHTKDILPMISGRKLLAWVSVSWCLSHTLRSSWRLRPIRTTRLFCKSQFYPDCNAFRISLMIIEQAISKTPLRVFQSPKVIPRKMTKYSSVTLVVKNL